MTSKTLGLLLAAFAVGLISSEATVAVAAVNNKKCIVDAGAGCFNGCYGNYCQGLPAGSSCCMAVPTKYDNCVGEYEGEDCPAKDRKCATITEYVGSTVCQQGACQGFVSSGPVKYAMATGC